MKIKRINRMSKVQYSMMNKNRILTKYDKADYKSTKQEVWYKSACWERFRMIKDGLLRTDSPRKTWELTEKGKEEAKYWKKIFESAEIV